jgi:RimJ/RimL family protein N-acetyltransferase
MPEPSPVGPEVDATPRALPARTKLRGRYVELEPLHRRHVPELWQAMQGADESWTYLNYGPFASAEALDRFVGDFATTHDPMVWAVRPVATGVVSGWLSLLDIQPRNAVIELGHIWFGPKMQRTRAGTEAMFLLLRLAADDLGYRCASVSSTRARCARIWWRRAGAATPPISAFWTTNGPAAAMHCWFGSTHRISAPTARRSGGWRKSGVKIFGSGSTDRVGEIDNTEVSA